MNEITLIIAKVLFLTTAIYTSYICIGTFLRKQTVHGLNIFLMALSIAGFVALQCWL